MTEAPAPDVSVVVVTWNGRVLLERCLPALLAQRAVQHEILVVDNGSSDGSADWIASAFPAIQVIRLDTNEGFAAANNRGIQVARAPLIATLNNDTVPEPDWLAALSRAAATYPEAGMFASQMVFDHQPDVINAAGIATDALGIAWDRRSGEPAGAGQPAEVFGASAGAALYRRELLQATGGFDPKYFAYLEDVDLAWRAQWLGWRARYVPDAVVRHLHSATGVEESPFKTYQLGRNKVVTVLKNYPIAALLRYGPLLLAYDLASLPITVWRQRNLAAVRGRLAALRQIRSIWRRRRLVMRRRKVSWAELAARLDPIRPPWVMWRRQRALRSRLAARRP